MCTLINDDENSIEGQEKISLCPKKVYQLNVYRKKS